MSERDPEMMERANAVADDFVSSHGIAVDWLTGSTGGLALWLAAFARAELVRELEALRRERCCRVVASDDKAEGWNEAMDFVSEWLDARLAALRGTEQQRVENAQADLPAPASSRPSKVGEFAEARDDGDLFRFGYDMPPTKDGKMLVWDAWCAAAKIEARVRAECAIAEPEDHDVLDRAAGVMERECNRDSVDSTVPYILRNQAAQLRAASAKPALEPDWIERMADDAYTVFGQDLLAAFLRERLAPVAKALEYAAVCNPDNYLRGEAKRALAALRGEVKP